MNTQPQIAQVGYMRIPIPPNVGILRCEICGADIGTFDPADLALPLRVDMFKAIGPGFPPPFRYDPQYKDSLSWEQAHCPVCRNRPFLDRDSIMTPAGKFKIGNLAIPRKVTPEEEANRKRQAELEAIWTEEGLDIHEEITMDDLREMYPGKSQCELNQLMIDMQEWDEAEGPEEKAEVETQEEAVPIERPQAEKRGRGRPRKLFGRR